MFHIFQNTDTTLHIPTSQVIVDQFAHFSGKKKITVAAHTQLHYLIIWDTSHIDLDITTLGDGGELYIYGLFFAGKWTDSVSNISLAINHSHTQAHVHLISFVQDNTKMHTDGSISLASGLQKVQSHLLEENIILGKNISIKAKPILNISSNDVQASHGAKIEKIDAEKLLYMTSRGLTPEQAQALVVQWYLNYIADQLTAWNGCQEEKTIHTILEDIRQRIFKF